MADPVGARPVRWGPVAGVAASLLFLAACGRAPAAPRASSAPPPPSSPPSSTASLAALDPCALLSPEDRSTSGITALGKAKTIGEARACDWTVPSTYGVTVTLDEANGLANLDVSSGKRTAKTVGTHRAMQVTGRHGTCAVLLSVGGSSSVQVDVSNANFADVPLACSRAGSVAGLVEHKLP